MKTFTQADKLSILEQMIDDGEVDYMDTIRALSRSNAMLLKACKRAIYCEKHNGTLSLPCLNELNQAIFETERTQ